jgi:DNA-binding MarR family transcriptional regulator
MARVPNWKVYINGDLVTLEQESEENSQSDQEQSCTAPQGSGESCGLSNHKNDASGQAAIHNTGTKRSTQYEDRTDTAAREKNTTRASILQALSNRISRLTDIAHFAGVDPSTAHYHLRNLIEEEKVVTVSRSKYTLPGSHFFDNFVEEGSHFFEEILENSSQYTGDKKSNLHPLEKKNPPADPINRKYIHKVL